jgi:single-stranded DNA-binding protein
MQGENFVRLQGRLVSPSLKTVGQNNSSLFKARLAIPVGDDGKRNQWIKVAAWAAIAEGLGELSENTFVKIHGHIEERSYDGKCRHCNGFEKKYWTEVVIDNFVVKEG